MLQLLLSSSYTASSPVLLNCLYLNLWVFALLPSPFSSTSHCGGAVSGCVQLSCLPGITNNTYMATTETFNSNHLSGTNCSPLSGLKRYSVLLPKSSQTQSHLRAFFQIVFISTLHWELWMNAKKFCFNDKETVKYVLLTACARIVRSNATAMAVTSKIDLHPKRYYADCLFRWHTVPLV